jgi:butyryl-CoA dehydrogenase
MDLKLSKEQEMIRQMAREFADKEVCPLAQDIDKSHKYPIDLAMKMGKLGLMGMMVEPAFGGAGTDTVSYTIAIEEISRASAAVAIIMSVNNSLVCYPLQKNANEAQKKKYLPDIATGKKIGAFALTEPSAGTDAGAQQTIAVKKDNEYILNGSKIFITNATNAETFILFALTDKTKGAKGISAFIIEKNFPGFSIGTVEELMGIRGSGQAELVMDNCHVPAENLLGPEGAGFGIAMGTLDCGRIGVAAQAVGIAQAALDESCKYSMEREQFGKPIGKFQAIQWMVADMATEIEAARLLVRKAAQAKDTQKKFSSEAAMAKLYASEMVMKATTKAVQIHGGYGYTKDYLVERLIRDAKITEIYEGTSEVQRMVIAGGLLK